MIMKDFFRENYKWIIFLLLISAGSLSAELINNRLEMPDLEVYYKAAERLVDGEDLYRDIEEDPYEHYVYKYAPPAAMLFIPFLPLGITVSKFLYWLLLTFLLGAIMFRLRSIFLKKPFSDSSGNISILLGILVFGTHFFRELHLGQVNLLLLGFYVFALSLLSEKKAKGFGAVIAVSIFIKPFGLIFLPLLFIMGRYRELKYIFGFSLLMVFIPYLFYIDPEAYAGLYFSWYKELSIELGNKQDLLAVGNHTIFSLLARYTPIGLINLEGTVRILYQALVMLMIGLFFLWYYFRNDVKDRSTRLFIILVAIIPLFSFTSYNAFIFTLPLLMYLLFKFRELNIIFRIFFVISCVLIGGNIYDIVGRELFDFLWEISVYSWGTIGLLLTIFLNWNKLSAGNTGK